MKVEERQVRRAADVFLGDGDDEAQVGTGKNAARLIVAVDDALGERLFLFTIQERILTDLAEIHLDGVVVGIRASVVEFLAREHGVRRRVFKHAAAFQDVDASRAEALVHFFEQVHVVLDRREFAEDLVVCDVPTLFTELDQCFNFVLRLTLDERLLSARCTGQRSCA